MADDRLTSYANIAALEEEQTKIIKLVDDTITHIQSKQKELGNVQISLLDANSAKASNDGIREAKKLIDSLSGSVYTYKQLLAQLVEVEDKKNKASAEQRIELAKIRLETERAKAATIESKKSYLEEAAAIRSSAAEKKKYAIDTTIARDSNIGLSKTLQDLRKGYDLLTKAERENADIGGVLASRIQQIDTQLKATDASTGRFQRNVGNYSSATANLNRNIAVLATELPNAGISIRTFAQSLSNNITPFIQSIREVQIDNAKLREEGGKTTSVMKTLGQSLLSTGVITGVAVAVGLKLIDMWQKGSKTAQEAEKSIEKYNAAINSAEETERSAAQQQIARLNVLTKLAQDNAQSTRTRTLAVEELQKTYPSTFGALSKQIILEGDLTDAINKATNALLSRAAAQAAEKKFAAASENVYDLTKLKEQAIKDAQKAEADFNNFFKLSQSSSAFAAKESTAVMLNSYRLRAVAAKESVDKIDKDLKKSTQEQLGFLKDATDNAAKAGDALFKAQETAAEKASKKTPKDKTKSEEDKKAAARKKASEDLAATILQQMNDIALKEEQITESSLDSLLTSFENQEIGIKEYAAKKEQIVKQSEDTILKYQIESLMTYLKAEGLLPDEIAKIQEKITDLTIKETEKRNKAREAAAENLNDLMQQNLLIEKQILKKASDQAEDELKKSLNFERNARMQLNQEIIKAAWEVADMVAQAFKASYERKEEELLKENENIDANTEKQVKAIEESTLAEEEKLRRISEAEAVAQAEKEKNELKIADLKTRSARLDKMIEIAKIGGQTISDIAALKGQLALATAEAVRLGALVLANPLLAPAASAMAASVGIIGATIGVTAGLGAAQIAAVSARPIPKYAEGTGSHKGGLAILGDGKEHELVIEPNKKPYWSANTDTLYNLPKHTQVIPESKLGSAVTQPSNKDVVMAVMEMSGLIDGGLNKLNRTIRNKETVRLEAKNRRWQDYYYENAKA
jgi:hypothetical protein